MNELNNCSLGTHEAGSFPDFLFGDFRESLTGLDLNVEVLFDFILGNLLGEVNLIILLVRFLTVDYFIYLKQFGHLLEDKFHVFHVFVGVDN